MATGALSRELRVVLVDDHPVYRVALEALITAREGLRVVGTTGTGEGAVVLVHALSPDVVVTGLRLPGIDGVETTRRICAGGTRSRVIILTVLDDDESIFRSISAGAHGYLVKTCSGDEIMEAIHTVGEGGVVFSSSLVTRLSSWFGSISKCRDAFAHLSPREHEVLQMVVRGLDNPAIAHSLGVSPKTVRNLVSIVFGKLQVTDRAAAAAKARAGGLRAHARQRFPRGAGTVSRDARDRSRRAWEGSANSKEPFMPTPRTRAAVTISALALLIAGFGIPPAHAATPMSAAIPVTLDGSAQLPPAVGASTGLFTGTVTSRSDITWQETGAINVGWDAGNLRQGRDLDTAYDFTPAGVTLTVTYTGSVEGTAPLYLTPTPAEQIDDITIGCRTPTGDPLLYDLGAISAGRQLGVTTTVRPSIQIASPISPFPPFFPYVDIASPTLSLGDAAVRLPVTGDGATLDLGVVQPNNIAPLITVAPGFAGDEGTAVNFSATAFGPCVDGGSFEWRFSDGTSEFGATASKTFTDANGLTDTDSFTVSVGNVAPRVTVTPTAPTTAWGRDLTFTAQAVDPGSGDQATLTYAWVFGDGTEVSDGGSSETHRWATPGSYSVRVTVCDKNGGCALTVLLTHVTARATTTAYTGDNAADHSATARLAASVVDEFGQPVTGASVAFTLDARLGGRGVHRGRRVGVKDAARRSSCRRLRRVRVVRRQRAVRGERVGR